MSRLAVFGYASLVSRASAAQTLGREMVPCPLARLTGWRRRWSQVRDNERAEKTFARADGGALPPFMLGLNIEPGATAEADAPNGALIELSERELDRLDRRELRYERIDVTPAIPAAAELGFERVFAYTARPENFAAEPPAGAVILRPYAETVEAAFAEHGEEARRLYLETTGPPPVELIEGILVRDSIPEGNPRTW